MILVELIGRAQSFYDALNTYPAIVFARYKMLIGRNPKWVQREVRKQVQNTGKDTIMK